MQNGMVNNSITYKLLVGNSNNNTFQQLLKIYAEIFKDADIEFFTNRFREHSKVISVLAFNKKELIGFKVGYPYDEDTFYSWVGGVLPNYRKQGIANKLAEQQELEAKSQGFNKIRNKSMNEFKPMMILNLKRGFDIVKFYTNSKEQTKIVFEKHL